MILVFVSCFLKVASQNSLNDYKYVIVESQFHFQGEPNQFNLNELTRFLLKKQGFKPILESEIFPDDLKSNYCLALQSEVKARGFLRTIVTVTLKDCNNNILYQAEGITKEKDLEKAYSYGIRLAFENFKEIKYNYVPNDAISSRERTSAEITKDDSVEVEKLKAEIAVLKGEKEISEATKVNEETSVKSKEAAVLVKTKKSKKYLEAVAVDDGYKLIDVESKKVIYNLAKTGMDNVYTIEGNKGLVYKKNGQWYREYTKGKKTLVEILNIVF